MAEHEPGLDPVAQDARLTALDERLARAKGDAAVRNGEAQGDAQANYSLGNRVLAELIGGMVGGALVGWVLDRFLHTSPWFLLGLLFLGIAAAFRNIIRISSGRSK